MNRTVPCASSQRGMTLPELLVAMILSTMVILAAVSVVAATRLSFGTVDAASQLRDNARFATSLLQQIISQAGYKNLDQIRFGSDINFADEQQSSDRFIGGLDARTLTPSSGTTTSEIFSSDLLVVRYMPPSNAGSGKSSGKSDVLHCQGRTEVSTERMVSNTFFIREDPKSTESTLYCRDNTSKTGDDVSLPLIPGVETFQVLYGINDTDTPTQLNTDQTFRYLSANAISDKQWKRVRTIRIGMVLRSTSAEKTNGTNTVDLYPLGPDFISSNDPGSTFKSPADGRLRQVVTFTVSLRNPLDN